MFQLDTKLNSWEGGKKTRKLKNNNIYIHVLAFARLRGVLNGYKEHYFKS